MMAFKQSIFILTLTITCIFAGAVNSRSAENEEILMKLQQIDFSDDDNQNVTSNPVTRISTIDPYQFRYVPVAKKGCFKFWIKANEEAHISLSNSAQYINPKIKIMLGTTKNTLSTIVLNDNVNGPPVKTNTPNILNGNEYRGFWIRWTDNGDIIIGKNNERFPFIVYKHSEQWYPINFVGVTCGPQIKGSWIIDENPSCPY